MVKRMCDVLIVPSGIETFFPKILISLIVVLIVPSGIETRPDRATKGCQAEY